MQIKTRSRLIVFILSFLVWAALTPIRNVQEMLAGLVVSALVSFLAGHFLITTEKRRPFARRIIPALLYFFRFLWEMVKANVHVAYLVLHPNLPIRPGIVKIRTRLTKDSAITVLTNSITLTPGTLTVDVNPGRQEIYVHWIDIRATDVEQATRLIAGKFEGRLMEVFE
ncbi:MAG TPA: cation:proton antiporter [bacterium]|nr:cation:proton antiporter [bacterium]